MGHRLEVTESLWLPRIDPKKRVPPHIFGFSLSFIFIISQLSIFQTRLGKQITFIINKQTYVLRKKNYLIIFKNIILKLYKFLAIF